MTSTIQPHLLHAGKLDTALVESSRTLGAEYQRARSRAHCANIIFKTRIHVIIQIDHFRVSCVGEEEPLRSHTTEILYMNHGQVVDIILQPLLIFRVEARDWVQWRILSQLRSSIPPKHTSL